MGIEDLGTLNLADADLTKGDFDPIPPAVYEMHVHEVKLVEVKNDTGRYPLGTPGFNVQFRVDGGKYDNRVVFKAFYLPPADYDSEKRKIALGIFANFLIAIGYPQEEVTSGSFNNDPTDWVGRKCKVSVKIRPANAEKGYSAQNEVTSVKPLAATSASESTGAGIL